MLEFLKPRFNSALAPERILGMMPASEPLFVGAVLVLIKFSESKTIQK